MQQTIPEEVLRWERKTRGVDGGVDLSGKMEIELSEWVNRRFHIVEAEEDLDEGEYMNWYSRITRRLVGRPIPISSEFQRMVSPISYFKHSHCPNFVIFTNIHSPFMETTISTY